MKRTHSQLSIPQAKAVVMNGIGTEYTPYMPDR